MGPHCTSATTAPTAPQCRDMGQEGVEILLNFILPAPGLDFVSVADSRFWKTQLYPDLLLVFRNYSESDSESVAASRFQRICCWMPILANIPRVGYWQICERQACSHDGRWEQCSIWNTYKVHMSHIKCLSAICSFYSFRKEVNLNLLLAPNSSESVCMAGMGAQRICTRPAMPACTYDTHLGPTFP